MQKPLLVGDVLDHFHGADQIELAPLGNQFLGGRHAVVDRETGGARVPAGRIDAFRRQVDAGDRGAETGERLAQQAAAAADVERAQAVERLLGERIAPEPERRCDRGCRQGVPD